MTDVTTTPAARIRIFDTTLRDGEQCPGAAMTFEQKLAIAELLDSMGVDVIEAGFPNSSPEALRAVDAIATRSKNAIICGLARAVPEDIRIAARALIRAKQPRIHTFIATSDLHLREKLKISPDELLERISASVSLARNLCDDVEWSAEDATRTDLPFLARCVETAIRAGATTINLPDTVGYSTFTYEGVSEVQRMFAYMRDHVDGADKVVFSTHCHNDLGMAVGNSVQALFGGARQVECTINGIGERAGNAALEEIVMALKVRQSQFVTAVDSTKLMQASLMVARASAFPVQYNKAIVGRNALNHGSGIHQDGVIKSAATYEIFKPEDIGLKCNVLTLTRHSGKKGLREALRRLGYNLGDNELGDFYDAFLRLADKKKEVGDDDLLALLGEAGHAHDRLQLQDVTIHQDDRRREVRVFLAVDGRLRNASSSKGNGPVDMMLHAISKVSHIKNAKLKGYHVNAVTEGADAQAETHVRVEYEGREYGAKASDPDTVKAAGMAFVRALNKIRPE